MKGKLFVLGQIIILLMLLARNGIYSSHYLAMGIEIIAVTIALWSVYSMNKSKLNIFPEPSSNGKLIKSGPYQYIRHPMYSSLILYFSAFLIEQFNWENIFLNTSLILLLNSKLKYEEQLLIQVYPSYLDYQKNSSRLIPFLY